VTLPRDLVRSGCPLDSMPELGNRDRSNLKLIIGPGRHPVLEVESALFATNHNVRVQNYRHLLAGALRVLRAAFRSWCHALASFFGKFVAPRSERDRENKPMNCSPGR